MHWMQLFLLMRVEVVLQSTFLWPRGHRFPRYWLVRFGTMRRISAAKAASRALLRCERNEHGGVNPDDGSE